MSTVVDAPVSWAGRAPTGTSLRRAARVAHTSPVRNPLPGARPGTAVTSWPPAGSFALLPHPRAAIGAPAGTAVPQEVPA
jgi:hypothetical protein